MNKSCKRVEDNMDAENTDCPICKQNGKLLFNKVRDYFILKGNSPEFSIYFCNNCEIGYSLPMMTDQELSKYYPTEYEAYVPKKSLLAFLQVTQYKKDLKIIKKIFFESKDLSIFEIGAGRGEFLFEAKKQGFAIEGIEPSEVGRQFAGKEYNLSLESGLGSDIEFHKKYDVVVLRHVLEHINNPKEILRKIIENGLNTNGLLFLKIPRMDSAEARLFKKFWHGFDLPRHRINFTKTGIIKLLNELGYTNVIIKSEIVPTDIIRSIGNNGKHGSSMLLKILVKIFSKMPTIIQLFFGQLLGTILGLFGTGRMIVLAQKKGD